MSQGQKHIQRRGCFWIFLILMMIIGSFWGACLGFFTWVLEDARNTISTLETFRPKTGTKVYADTGELLYTFSIEDRQLVPLSQIPLHVQKAFIATEDALFYSHKGVRIDAIINAFIYGLKTGRFRGGSTITQQVVRNVETLGVGQERTIKRKIREAIVAMQVEREFTKDEILELYLNQVFLGINAYGVESASRQYFGKSVKDLTLGEAATLAGLTRAPNVNDPINHLQNAIERRNIVLKQMLEEGFISEEDYKQALSEDLASQVITPEKRAKLLEQGIDIYEPYRIKAPYFVEEIRKILLSKYSVQEVFESGMLVYTTLDYKLQKTAEDVLQSHLSKFDEPRKKNPDFIPVSGALVCIDNRPGYEGFIRALVGGRSWEEEKYNTATQAKRQPGSSVKPFIWCAGISAGMTPSSIINDAPFLRVMPNKKIWAPKNFDGKFSGPIPIRQALERSVNIVSVKIVDKLGLAYVRPFFEKCELNTVVSDVVGLTLGLGTVEVTVLSHTLAYSVFAHNGMKYYPIFIKEIKNQDGLTLYNYKRHLQRERVMDPRVAYVVMHMMKGCCTPDPKLGYYPTGHRASQLKRPVAGKTGTTNNSRDAWFCGLTADFTTVVWVGYKDNRSLGRGINYTGGRLACPIWVDFMKVAEEGLPIRDFIVPPGIRFFNIDRLTGVLGGNYTEAYVEGTYPPTSFIVPPETEEENIPQEALVENIFEDTSPQSFEDITPQEKEPSNIIPSESPHPSTEPQDTGF
ncbi:MAG: PBP1A family penicillin-binding protein [Candidatus Hydrogenedentes bacterium]|nr:PBP1A family penicillin-binding protein [Candidatus Hydrogenedentota bacterium]